MRWTISRGLAATVLAAVWAHGSPAFSQTPEQEKQWEEQRAAKLAIDKAKAEQLAKQREARKADPMAWVRTLDPLVSGGWVFRAVGADGSWATFSTEHQLKRSGHTVTAWVRQEFPEPTRNPDGDTYLSSVEQTQYDCAKEKARILLAIYYAGNNLTGSQQSDESDIKQLPWDAIVPGTQSELVFHWACYARSTGARPR